MPLEAGTLVFTVAGVVLSKLVNVLEDLITNGAKYKKNLEDQQERLDSLPPLVYGIKKLEEQSIQEQNVEKLYLIQTVQKELKELIAKGDRLLSKCQDNPDWKFWGRLALSPKLIEYDEEVSRFYGERLNVISLVQALNTVNTAGASISSIRRVMDRCDVLKLSNFKVGIDGPLQELKELLLKGKDPLCVLSGAGGSGKTTLANELYHDLEVEEKYKTNRFFVTVKRTPMKEVVQKLCKHKGYPVADIPSEQDAKERLQSLITSLEPDPVLFILDDVLDSEFPINCFVFEKPDYKVLVTSRMSLFSEAPSCRYKLKLLEPKDAMELFRHYAFPNNSDADGNFIEDDLVNQVVSKCENNPLILKVMAGLLKGKDKVVWECTLKDWSEKLRTPKNEQIDTLHLCVDALENKGFLKDCFYDLACFPDDIRIPAAALIDMWVELYKFDENKAMENLLQLFENNLVDMMTTRLRQLEGIA